MLNRQSMVIGKLRLKTRMKFNYSRNLHVKPIFNLSYDYVQLFLEFAIIGYTFLYIFSVVTYKRKSYNTLKYEFQQQIGYHRLESSLFNYLHRGHRDDPEDESEQTAILG